MEGPLSEIPQLCGCCDSAPGDPRRDPAAQSGNQIPHKQSSRSAQSHAGTCFTDFKYVPGKSAWTTTPALQKPAAVPTAHSEEDTAAPAKPRGSSSSRSMARRGVTSHWGQACSPPAGGPHEGEDSCLGVREIQAPWRRALRWSAATPRSPGAQMQSRTRAHLLPGHMNIGTLTGLLDGPVRARHSVSPPRVSLTPGAQMT